MFRRWFAPGAVSVVVAAPLVAFAIIWQFPDLDPMLMRFHTHFWAVGATSLAALAACGVMVASAQTRRHLVALPVVEI